MDCIIPSAEKQHSNTGIITAKMILILAVWLALVFFSFHLLLAYEAKPGPTSGMTATWPLSSGLQLSSEPSFTLVMCVHPQCPCSNASISELAILMTRCRNIKAYLLFVRPKGFGVGWEKTALWQRAATIANVEPKTDIGGALSSLFSAWTSGETALYDRRGNLLFQGGITGARGHEGDNQGMATIEAIVADQAAPTRKTAVFGCPLSDCQSPLVEAK
jgi:hypothetical protein